MSSGDSSDENNVEISFILGPGEKRDVEFRIFGVDPTAAADDSGSSVKEMKVISRAREEDR